MSLKESQRSLRAWTNKNGVLRVVRSRQKRGKDISQKKAIKAYLLKSMLNQLEKNEKILKKESNTVSTTKEN